jgi:hypothetical protein
VDQSGDVEQQRIKINQMLRYVKGLETAIQQMQLRGISESDISFYRDLNNDGDDSTTPEAGEFYNPNCTSNACLVFHVDGGGVSPQDPPTGLNDGSDWIYTGRIRVANIGNSASADPSASDLLIILPNVNRASCIQINNVLDIDNPSGNPPKDGANSNPAPYFAGQFMAGNLISSAELNGKAAACYDGDTSSTTPPEGTYQFYYTLITR